MKHVAHYYRCLESWKYINFGENQYTTTTIRCVVETKKNRFLNQIFQTKLFIFELKNKKKKKQKQHFGNQQDSIGGKLKFPSVTLALRLF